MMLLKYGLLNGRIVDRLYRVPSSGKSLTKHSYKYFPRENRKVKIEEFINIRQGSMSIE